MILTDIYLKTTTHDDFAADMLLAGTNLGGWDGLNCYENADMIIDPVGKIPLDDHTGYLEGLYYNIRLKDAELNTAAFEHTEQKYPVTPYRQFINP